LRLIAEGEAMSEALEKIRAKYPSVAGPAERDAVRFAEALDVVRLSSDDKAMRTLAERILREVAGLAPPSQSPGSTKRRLT